MILTDIPKVTGVKIPFELLIRAKHPNIIGIKRNVLTGGLDRLLARNLVTNKGDEYYAYRGGGSVLGGWNAPRAQLGTGLVSNGCFSSDTIWGKGTDWSIDAPNNKAVKTAGTASDLDQDIAVTQGTSYDILFTLTGVTGGNLTPKIGGTAGTARTADGDYTDTIVAGSGGAPRLQFSADASFAGEISLVAVSKTPAKTDTALETPIVPSGTISGSTHAIDTGYPKANDDDVDNDDRGTDATTWRITYEKQAAVVTDQTIIEFALVDGAAPTNLICRGLFTKPFTKTSNEIMKLFANHTFNGV